MSSVPPPTKPPRGIIKSPKEKSCLLMTVIRTLSTSESVEQRDKEKAKLELEFKTSDHQLDELISVNDTNLTQVMQTFSKVSALVNSSRDKIRVAKENLVACKTLLNSRRDDLEKLWRERIEHKHTLHLLEQIDQLQETPSQLASCLAEKRYLHATQLLVSLDNDGSTLLKGADGLADLRAELHKKTQVLHSKLLEELGDQLYVQSTKEVVASSRFQHRDATTAVTTSLIKHSSTSLNQANTSSPAARRMLDFSGHDCRMSDTADLIEDVDQPNPENDSDNFMATIIECLALLNKLPETVQSLRSTMHDHLLALIERTTQTCLSQTAAVTSSLWSSVTSSAAPGVTSSLGSAATVTSSPAVAVTSSLGLAAPGVTSSLGLAATVTSSPAAAVTSSLLELQLQLLIEQLKLVAAAHSTVLGLLSNSVRSRGVKITLYTINDYWAQVQATLQQVLTRSAHLEVEQTSATVTSSDGINSAVSAFYSEHSNDISAYFGRRKLQRTRKSLFKFENSTYSLTMNSCYSLDRQNCKYGDNQRENNQFCSPSAQNITLLSQFWPAYNCWQFGLLEERDKEKAKLEQEFKNSDHHLQIRIELKTSTLWTCALTTNEMIHIGDAKVAANRSIRRFIQ